MSTTEQYSWIELAALCARGKMKRGEYVRIDDTNAVTAWREQFDNRDVFASVGRYAEPDHTSEFIVPVFFDIDSPADLAEARESTLALCVMLMDRISVPQDSLDIYFSGSKGFHVLVPCEVFDAFPSPHVLTLYKGMAQKAEQHGINFIDNNVYTNRRIWRLPNSINTKSGRFKIPLTFEDLRDINITGILELAQSPRPDDSLAILNTCKQTSDWYRTAINHFETRPSTSQSSVKKINEKFRNGWRMLPCVKAIQETALGDGSRHRIYMILARYYSYLNMHHDEIVERIERIDSRNPIHDAGYIERIINFGQKHPGFSGCDERELQKYCRNNNCFYAKLKNRDGKNRKTRERTLFKEP